MAKLRKHFSRLVARSFLAIVALVVFGAVMTAYVPYMVQPASAAGAIGGGGDPGGGSGGAQTSYGWSWYDFPSDNTIVPKGLRNGGSWSTVTSQCRSIGANRVIAFLIQSVPGSTNPANAVVYQYKSYYEPYRGHIPSGGGWISTATAASYYNSPQLDPYRAGFTFGVNVAWFCYSTDPPPKANFDGANCTHAWGWAFDPSRSSQSIYAHLQVDGVTRFWGTANTSRPDVNAAYGITGNHGFDVNIAAWVSDGRSHTVQVFTYNINSSGAVTGGAISIGTRTVSGCRSDWRLSGSTGWSTSSTYPGQTVRFTSTITNNNEGGTASFVYGPRYFYSNTSNPSRLSNGAYPGEVITVSNKSATLAPNGSITGITEGNITVQNNGAGYICGTVAFDPSSSRGDRNGRSPAKCITINHPTLSCNSYAPTSVEVGQGFTATATLRISGSTADINFIDSLSKSFYIEIYLGSTKKFATATPTVTRSGAIYTLTASVPGLSPGGAYTFSYGSNSSFSGANVRCPAGFNPGDSNPPPNLDVSYHPFFTASGGDISSQGGITSWNEDGGSYAGAGTHLAALATGNITSFVSGVWDGIGGPSSLAFANTTASGTKYGSGYDFTPNYPAVDTTGATAITTSSLNLSNLNGVYVASNDTTISGNVPADKNITIVLTSGNLYIGDRIWYSYGSDIKNIPRLTVIVQSGNIYVNANVQEVHGVFYANGSGSNGRFYSCATANGVPANDYTTCNKQLIVYGAVTAQKLILGRTYGSVHASPGVPSAAAERFVYSPEVWLLPISSPSGSSQKFPYDYFRSLPPIL